MNQLNPLIENVKKRVEICDLLTNHCQPRRRSVSMPGKHEVPSLDKLKIDNNETSSNKNNNNNTNNINNNSRSNIIARSHSLSFSYTFDPGYHWPYDDKVENFIASGDKDCSKYPLTSVFLALLNNYYKIYEQTYFLKNNNNSNQNQIDDNSNSNSNQSDNNETTNCKLLVNSIISSVNDPSTSVNQKKFSRLSNFLKKIENSYQNVPYHNHYHAVDVLTAVDVLMNQIEECELAEFTLFERFTTLLAAACHDVGHPGVTAEHIMRNQNRYSVESEKKGQTADDENKNKNDENIYYHLNLTRMFKNDDIDLTEVKDKSEKDSKLSRGMLERYHSTLALSLMREYGLDLAFNDDFTKLFNDCIMATDMSNHASIVQTLKTFSKPTTVDEDDKSITRGQKQKLSTTDRWRLLPIILHIADLSNPAKNFTEAQKWAYKVCDEFFQQGDIERVLNKGQIGVQLHDREKTTVFSCQIGFIKFCTLPLMSAWRDLLSGSVYAQSLVDLMVDNCKRYEDLAQEVKR